MRQFHRHSGFTLIEAIGAVVLLSVATPALFWALRDAQVRRADPAAIVTARWLAVERLETIMADRHSPDRGYAYITPGSYPNEASINGFSGYARSVSISETGPTLAGPGTGYKTVRVVVSFAGSGGSLRSFELSTVITDS